MSDFLEHLQQQGATLHVVPAAKFGGVECGVFLTEDSNVSWDTVQSKRGVVANIADWRGMVRVNAVNYRSAAGADDLLNQWGEYGCRIGDFLLFGDAELLRRIQGTFHR
jgi:hypothetical protein